MSTRTVWAPEYDRWRHGGWYVTNVRYPSGAVGCVSRNYPDKRWRIVCDPRPDAHALHTYRTRDEAARAERELTIEIQTTQLEPDTITKPKCVICRTYYERDDNFCQTCGLALHALAHVDAQIARTAHEQAA